MRSEWAEVRNCPWLHQAQFLKSVLSAAGIEAMIPNEHTLGIQPLYANLLGGAQALVRAGDLERAAEILNSGEVVPSDPAGDDRDDPAWRRHRRLRCRVRLIMTVGKSLVLWDNLKLLGHMDYSRRAALRRKSDATRGGGVESLSS